MSSVDPALPDTVEECTARGKELIREGNNDLAIACLCKALELSVAKHGSMAPCCADAYYAYAEVLLLKAQGENDPFGDAVQKLEDEDVEDEDVDSDEDAPPKVKAAGSSGAGGSAQPDGDNSEGEEGEGEDGAVDDLRLAWECFETARLLYAKVTDEPRAKERVGECLLGLGDIRMENGARAGRRAPAARAFQPLSLPPHLTRAWSLHYLRSLTPAQRTSPAQSPTTSRRSRS
jgi:nuclear autoantigenic sperm protein